MAHANKLVDMKRSSIDDEEKLEEASLTRPSYDYGLCLSLNEASLDKLGIEDGELPAIGETCHLCCEAKVTAVSKHSVTGRNGEAETHQSVELQITRLGIAGDPVEEAEEKSEARRQRFYKA